MEYRGYGIPTDWSREPSECHLPGPQVRQKTGGDVGRCDLDQIRWPVQQKSDVSSEVVDRISDLPATLIGVTLPRKPGHRVAPD